MLMYAQTPGDPPAPAALVAPHLTGVRGGVQIGPGYDGTCSAPFVVAGGQDVGLYIDDTTPNIRTWIRCAVAQFPHGVVLVGVAPGQEGTRYGPRPPVVNCLEVYPYGEGVPSGGFFPLKRYACYISQWNWPGIEGRVPPTARERERLLRRVESLDPRYVFTY